MLKFPTISLAAIVTSILISTSANAGQSYNPVSDKIALKECSACHMAFQPQMLPQKSWEKIMGNLSNHFGEDASLNPADAKHIKDYLMVNAADAGGARGRFLRGMSGSSTPIRITETPYWGRLHNHEIPERIWKDPRVKSKANCAACHREAASGYYQEE